tara:strand:- start:437 stop:1126 length:690 start_codon:yes stop_codon:yes gene_type:complete
MFRIKTISPNLFFVDDVRSKSPIGRRMTIIRLKNDELALHSPIYLKGTTKANLDSLGKVVYILVPNEWHTLDTKRVYEQYPTSKIITPLDSTEKLSTKFIVSGTYEKDWDVAISEKIEVYLIQGLKKPEAVFFHNSSKTLIVADLFFNFSNKDFSGITKILMGLNQATRFGTTRFYQWSMVKNKSVFKSSLEEMNTKWNIDRVIMGHGRIVEANGHKLISTAIQNLPYG